MDCTSLESLIIAAGAENIPVGAVFELTHRCNLRCSHCYLADYSGGGELSTAEWRAAISALAEMGGLWLSFTGGEIFLRSDLLELTAHARDCGFALKLLTNALLITEIEADRLAELWPSEVHVSLYAAEPALHDAVTGLKGSWEQTLGAVRLLASRELTVTLKMPVIKSNLDQIGAVRRLAEEVGAQLRIDTDIVPKNDGSCGPFEHRLSDEELDRLLRDENMTARIPPTQPLEPDLSGDICGAARRTFSISPKGAVQPCLSNPVSAGNIRDSSLIDIWRDSPVMLQFRNYRVSDLSSRCLKCRHLSYCGRCSALARLEDGDYLGPSCWACRMSEAKLRRMLASGEGGLT